METAQSIVAHGIGVLLLLWVVGYTILRAQEVLAKDAESPGEGDSEPEVSPKAADDDTAGKGSFGYAQRRRKDGRADAPFWGLVAAANGIRKVITDRRARRGGDDDGETAPEGDGRERQSPDEDDNGRPWRPGREEEQERQGDRPGDHADEKESRSRWGRRAGRRYQPEAPDFEVEEVPRYGPRDPELDRPIRALTPGGATEEPRPAEPAAEGCDVAVIRTTQDASHGRTEITMAGGSVAIPGVGGGVARSGTGGVAAVTGNGDSHDDAKELARKIVKAMGMTQDPVSAAVQMIKVTLNACWSHVDNLKDAGIGGSVLDGWIEAVMAYEIVNGTAKVLQDQLDDAKAAAATARRRQANHGDNVQDAVMANPKSTANSTGYYGKTS